MPSGAGAASGLFPPVSLSLPLLQKAVKEGRSEASSPAMALGCWSSGWKRILEGTRDDQRVSHAQLSKSPKQTREKKSTHSLAPVL